MQGTGNVDHCCREENGVQSVVIWCRDDLDVAVDCPTSTDLVDVGLAGQIVTAGNLTAITRDYRISDLKKAYGWFVP